MDFFEFSGVTISVCPFEGAFMGYREMLVSQRIQNGIGILTIAENLGSSSNVINKCFFGSVFHRVHHQCIFPLYQISRPSPTMADHDDIWFSGQIDSRLFLLRLKV